MNKAEFVRKLKSGRLSEIQEALDSERVPVGKEEVDLLLDIVQMPNSVFQQSIFNLALSRNDKQSLPLIMYLARAGLTSSIRSRAINKLIEFSNEQVYQTLLICTSDEDINIRCIALSGLQGWNNENAIIRLIDCAYEPNVAFDPSPQPHQIERIKSASIEGLATPKAISAIDPLLDLMQDLPSHRETIIDSLVSIGGSATVEAILVSFEELDNDEKDSHREYLKDAALIISRIGKVKRGQLKSYRKLLSYVIEHIISNVGRYSPIFESLHKYLNVDLANDIQPILERNLHNRHVFKYITTTKLIKMLPYTKFGTRGLDYLNQLWHVSEEEEYPLLIMSLFDILLSDHEAIEQAAQFIARNWQTDIYKDTRVIDYITNYWLEEDAQKDVIQAIIMVVSMQHATVNVYIKTLVEKAPSDIDDSFWEFIIASLSNTDDNVLLSTINDFLSENWNPRLLEMVLSLNESDGVNWLRIYLWDDEGFLPKEAQRVWALNQLQQYGSIDNFKQLAEEIEKNSDSCAVAAVQAIHGIGVNVGQQILRAALENRKPSVVMESLNALNDVTTIEVDTVKALQMRIQVDQDSTIQEQANAVLVHYKEQHLSALPSVTEDPEEEIEHWLTILRTFEPDQYACNTLEHLLQELGNSAAVSIRLSIANAVPDCCPPDQGQTIIENELGVERNNIVVSAWGDSLDRVKGLPDRSILILIESVCDVQINRKNILGNLSLADVFENPNITQNGLSRLLRRTERIKTDDDSLVVQLDSTAELLIDEVFLAAQLDPTQDRYGNRIGRTKRINPRIHLEASSLHGLRELAHGPHPKDSNQNPRQGVTAQDAAKAKVNFSELFKETIIHLRKVKNI